jgi:hypothetical protein
VPPQRLGAVRELVRKHLYIRAFACVNCAQNLIRGSERAEGRQCTACRGGNAHCLSCFPEGGLCPECGRSGSPGSCILCGGSGKCAACGAEGGRKCPDCPLAPGVCSLCGGRESVTKCRQCRGSGRLGPGACPLCNGAGIMRCPGCGGTGKCASCGGDGRIECIQCNSSGTCAGCGGSGKCRACRGTGKFNLEGDPAKPFKPCICGGAGKIVCPVCGGAGRIPAEIPFPSAAFERFSR